MDRKRHSTNVVPARASNIKDRKLNLFKRKPASSKKSLLNNRIETCMKKVLQLFLINPNCNALLIIETNTASAFDKDRRKLPPEYAVVSNVRPEDAHSYVTHVALPAFNSVMRQTNDHSSTVAQAERVDFKAHQPHTAQYFYPEIYNYVYPESSNITPAIQTYFSRRAAQQQQLLQQQKQNKHTKQLNNGKSKAPATISPGRSMSTSDGESDDDNEEEDDDDEDNEGPSTTTTTRLNKTLK